MSPSLISDAYQSYEASVSAGVPKKTEGCPRLRQRAQRRTATGQPKCSLRPHLKTFTTSHLGSTFSVILPRPPTDLFTDPFKRSCPPQKYDKAKTRDLL